MIARSKASTYNFLPCRLRRIRRVCGVSVADLTQRPAVAALVCGGVISSLISDRGNYLSNPFTRLVARLARRSNCLSSAHEAVSETGKDFEIDSTPNRVSVLARASTSDRNMSNSIRRKGTWSQQNCVKGARGGVFAFSTLGTATSATTYRQFAQLRRLEFCALLVLRRQLIGIARP